MYLIKKLLILFVLIKSTTLFSQYDSSSYYLSTKSTTSAGVYKNGRLVRTLWSNVEKPAGTFQFAWDRKNDSNQSITPPYGIKVVANNLKYRWTANIGNTSRDSVGPNKIRALRTPTDGVEVGNFIYFSTGFVEGNSSTFKIAKNDLKRMIPVRPSQCGDADGEIRFCATDSNLVYWAGLDAWARAWPSTNKTAPDTNSWGDCFIYATRVSNDNDYTFSSGVTFKPSLAQCRTYSAIGVTLKDTAAKPTGLAVMKTGNYLYLTQLGKGLVKCYNKTTGALVQTISLSLGDICIKDSIVYGIVGNSVRGYKINSNGTLSSTSFNVSITKPINVSCGNLIYVTVASTQQIKAYNTSGTLQWTYGQSGGYKGSPYVKNDKFHFADYNDLLSKGFTFPCLDGSFWISDAGNARQLRISSNRTYIEGFSYLPMNYNASASNKRVFAGFMEFNTDSNKLVANWSGNLKSGYLNIHRRDILSDIFVSNNRTFATIHYYPNGVYDDGGRTPEYVELTDTGIRYTGIRITPNTNRWFINSTTPNGDRYRYEYTESTSGVDTVHKRTFTGLNGSGNPTWRNDSVFALVPITANAPIRYCGEKINSNLVFFSANWANTGYHLGRVVNNKWIWMTSPSTARTYTGQMPVSDSFDCGNGVEYAGGRCYNVDSFYAWNYIGEFWKNSQTNVWKLFTQDGLMLGQFGKTGPQSASISGTYDAPIEAAGNGFSGQMVKKSNGNLSVYYNDESRHGAIGSFEISGLSTIRTLYPVTYLAIGDKASVKCNDGKIVFDIPYENKVEYSIDNGKTWLRLNIKSVDIYDNCLYKISKIKEGKVVSFEILNQPNCFDFNSIKIYPNPFSQSIIIESDVEYYRMIIRNQVGKLVIDKLIKNIGCSYEESTVSNLPKGFYFIQIISDDFIFNKKLIKS